MTRLAQPVASSVQKRIEPSSAAHRLIALMRAGVVVALFSTTYTTLKSCVRSEMTITPHATAAATKEPMIARLPLPSSPVAAAPGQDAGDYPECS